jgi:signal peptidase II
VPNAGAEPARPVPRGRGRLVVGIVGAVLVLDQATKAWAVAALPGSPVTLIGGTLELAVARNTGSAFSLFQTLTPLLAVVAVAIALVLVRVVRRTNERTVVVALALVLGGALGNLSDRLFRSPGWLRGAVVDFIHLRDWPTFNVADSAITIGAVLLVVWSAFGGRTREPST